MPTQENIAETTITKIVSILSTQSLDSLSSP